MVEHLELRNCSFDPSRVSIIASGRGRRPKQFKVVKEKASARATCPFCPGNEGLTPAATLVLTKSMTFKRESGDFRVKDWLVRVFPNKYPALRQDVGGGTPAPYGYHEVLVESPTHDEGEYLSRVEEIYYSLIALRERVREIMSDGRVDSVIVIKNSGPGAGASIPHPHLQIFANSFTPPALLMELEGFRGFIRSEGRCPLCVLRDSSRGSGREVLETEHFIAVTRYAPKQSYELLVVPKRHTSRFTEVSDEELRDLAKVLSITLRALKSVLGDVDYNYWVHTAPRNAGPREYHWHIEIQPLVETWGGYEKGSGVHIVTVPPEVAAERLRQEVRKISA